MEIKLNEKYNVNIYSQENEGLGVSKLDDMIVFVKNGLPGDKGDVLIRQLKKNFARGEMISFDKVSEERQDASCPYFNECGGCDLQHQKYDYQLIFKKNKIQTALERIGGFKDIKINDVIYVDEFNYRNKVTLKVDKNKVGFYKNNSYEVIDIKKCLISRNEINEAIKSIKMFINDHQNNTFKSIMIRYINGLMIAVESDNNDLNIEFKNHLTNLKDLKSVMINDNALIGEDYIMENINDLSFKLSPKSFYQVNNLVMKKLYNKVIEHVTSIENESVLDLYCGIGTITSLLSKHAKRMIGIEYSNDAINNANENIKINNLNNIIYIAGKVEDQIDTLINEKIDSIVMDPPRTGMDPKAIDSLIKIAPKQMIYVSCNPVTLARDLKIICNNGYKINEVTPFDMFPQTNHVETAVLISRVEK